MTEPKRSRMPIGTFILLFALLLVAPLAACGGGAPPTTPTPGPTPTTTPITIPPSTLSDVSGTVLVLNPGATSWQQATDGMSVDVGDSIKTGAGGHVLIIFFDGSIMELDDYTEVVVVDLDMAEGGSTTVNMFQAVGDTLNRVEQLTDTASSYEVETPAGVAVVRGTTFGLGVDDDGVTILDVDEGDACFEAQGDKVCAEAGYYIVTEPGNSPGQPQSNTPPDIAPPPPGFVDSGGPPPITGVNVKITDPDDGSTVDEDLVHIEGTVVSENQIPGPQGTITINGNPNTLPLTYEGQGSHHYSFDYPTYLVPGWNVIRVDADDGQGAADSDTINVFADIGGAGIKIELTWDAGSTDPGCQNGCVDLDAHFIAPGYAMWDGTYDCHWANPAPDWDGGGSGDDGDPTLDVDNTWGFGPELIELVAPPFDGTYQYVVDYWDYCVETTDVQVRVWINDVLAATYTHTFVCNGQMSVDGETVQGNPWEWYAACIAWDTGAGTGQVSPGVCNGY